MTNEGLSGMTYSQGIKEIEKEFKLNEPQSITVEILENKKSNVNNGKASMETYLEDPSKPIIYIYLDFFNDDLVWIGFWESIENIFLHELLHAYGDTTNDGLIRHNLVGVNTLIRLLNEFNIQNI